jgi:hypothetical protein
VFDADLTRLIQLYVVGVFTSFTLSQTGMVRHWLKEKRKGPMAARGWRRSIVINSVGATATAVVLCVVTYTKFTHGAWIVIAAMPFIVMMFLSIHRHYDAVLGELRRGRVRAGEVGANHLVLLVRDLDVATAEALGAIRSIRPTEWRVVYPSNVGIPAELRDFVNVFIPEVVQEGLPGYLIRRRALVRLKAGLLREHNIVVTDVPVFVEDGRPVGVDGRPLIPTRTVALVFVAGVNDGTIRALNFAASLESSEARAVYFDLDPEAAHRMQEEWGERGCQIPLDIVEAPFRDLTGPILEEVRRYTARRDTVVIVVLPEVVVRKWRHWLLHNQSALFVKRLLLYEPRVILSSVPFALEEA